jgi:hypothetical protein
MARGITIGNWLAPYTLQLQPLRFFLLSYSPDLIITPSGGLSLSLSPLTFTAAEQPLALSSGCAQNSGSIVNKYIIEPGTSTGGSATTCIDTSKSWTTNQWVGFTFYCFSPTFETSTITSNTSNTLTFGTVSTPITSGKSYGMSSAGSVAGTVSQFNQNLLSGYPLYSLNFNDWGSQQCTMTQWINTPACWGVNYSGVGYDNTAAGIGSYANVCRGWTNASGATSGAGYPASVGMGVQLSAMTKAKVHWSCVTPTAQPNQSRWDNLIDVYWWTTPDPHSLGSAFPPHVDMQIVPRLMDNGGFAGQNAVNHHYSTKTLGGNTYNVVISSQGSSDWGSGFSDATGYTVSFYLLPTTAATNGVGNQLWGQISATHDILAMATWLASSNPLDDSSAPVKNASGITVSAANGNLPMNSSWYLDAVNAGTEFAWDLVSADPFTTNNFWVSMQAETDGPASP